MTTRRCCCARDCLIKEDLFNRADSDTIGNGWVEDSGNWEIVSNKLECTTPGGVIHNLATNHFGSNNQVVRAKISDYVDGARYRLLVQVNSDGTDYYYAEWHYVDSSNMYFRIGDTNGVIEELGPDLPIPEGTVCEFSSTEKAQLCMQDSSSRMTVCSASKAGEYTGLAAGSAVVVTFDDWQFYAHEEDRSDCPSCDCSCEGYCIPDGLTATFENINECPELDGYAVDLLNEGPTKFGADWYSESANCPYELTEPIALKLRCTSGGSIGVENLQLVIEEGSASPLATLADPEVSTCNPISLRFGPYSYGSVSGGGFPTTCCGGAPGIGEESTFYIWVTE